MGSQGYVEANVKRKVEKVQELVVEGDVRERARLASLALPHAGDWLNTAPLVALGRHGGQPNAGGHPGSGCHYARICPHFCR